MVHDAVALRPSDGPLAERFGRYDVLAVAVLAGRRLEGQIERLDARVRKEPVERRCGPVGRRLLTDSSRGGGVLRVVGRALEAVDHVLRDLLGFVPQAARRQPLGTEMVATCT